MTPPGGGAAVKVDPARLEAVGGELAALCAELRSALAGLRSTAAGTAPATGEFGAPAAYGEMWQVWERDLSTLAAALCDLGQRVKTAAQAYRATDDRAAHRLGQRSGRAR
jgi:uncharacterized protein YukE